MNKPVFTAEYFYDEVREGFFVPEMMKRLWAAQLTVLYEIAQVCERHGITWYADMGTLLGTVRHKGYVPWDDDFDISMKREDWERFFACAKDELPEGYCVLSLRTEEEYKLALGRVTNSHFINTNAEHMEKYCGCPYVCGVDIFPIDRLYKDPAREKERILRAKAVSKVTEVVEALGCELPEIHEFLDSIEWDNNCVIDRNGNVPRQLRLIFEKISMECHDEDYDEVALMPTWLLHDWANVPKECYAEQTELPFENLLLPVTKEYDKLLSIYYHDYMTPKRSGGVHNYPVYKNQEETLREHMGHKPYRYTLLKENIKPCREVADVKNVLFLPCRESWWESMRGFYEELRQKPGLNVRLLHIPYFDKDPLGNRGGLHDERAFFENIPGFMSTEEYEKREFVPELVVIQFPFDGYSCAYSVDEQFFSSRLREGTAALWYLPCFEPEPPASEKDKAYAALETLVEQPALANADRVLINNGELRGFYIKKLVGLTGEDCRECWEKKIIASDEALRII